MGDKLEKNLNGSYRKIVFYLILEIKSPPYSRETGITEFLMKTMRLLFGTKLWSSQREGNGYWSNWELKELLL